MKTAFKFILFVAIICVSLLFITNATAAPSDIIPPDIVVVAVGEPPVPPSTTTVVVNDLPHVGINIVLLVLLGVMLTVCGVTMLIESKDKRQDRKPDT